MDRDNPTAIVCKRLEALGGQGKILAEAVVVIIHEAPDIAEKLFSVPRKDREYIPNLLAQYDRGGHTLLWYSLHKGQIDFADIFLGLCGEKELLKKTMAGQSLLMVSTSMRILSRRGRAHWVCRETSANTKHTNIFVV